MKTFLVVTLYAVTVAALDLGGAVWTSLHVSHAAMKTTAAAAASTIPVKTSSPVRTAGTIPSDT